MHLGVHFTLPLEAVILLALKAKGHLLVCDAHRTEASQWGGECEARDTAPLPHIMCSTATV
jgi:hypothetical protein